MYFSFVYFLIYRSFHLQNAGRMYIKMCYKTSGKFFGIILIFIIFAYLNFLFLPNDEYYLYFFFK